MVNNEIYKTLNFIPFANFSSWDVKSFNINSQKFNFKTYELKEVLSKTEIQWVEISDPMEYPILGVRSHGQGVYINRIAKGHELTMKRYQRSKVNTLFFCKVRTVGGQWGVVYPAFADSYASSNMTYLDIDFTKIMPQYLEMLLQVKQLTNEWDKNAIGADGRHFTLNTMLDLQIPLPSLAEQKQLVAEYQAKIDFANDCEKQAQELEQSIEAYLYNELNILFYFNKPENSSLLKFASFINLKEWSYNFLSDSNILKSDYDLTTLNCLIANFMIDDKGKSLTTMTSKDPDKNFIYIGMEDVDKNTGIVLNNNSVSGKEIKSATVQLPKNYFIYGKLRPYLNKFYFNQSDDPNIVVSSEFFVFNIKSKINSAYFKLVLGSFIIQEQIKNAMKGARMPRITKDIFLNLVIPVPPLEVQNKIADHIISIKNQIKELKQLAVDNRANAILDFEKAIFHNENN
jgi:type I restriction enzyme M protein